MRLRELKLSLAKLPPDMDDMEVLMTYHFPKGETEFECLCFTGYLPIKGRECIVLGSMSAIKQMIDDGEIPKPEGYEDDSDRSY